MISIENLCFSYNRNSDYILDNLNLNIENGSYTSIIGENGAGKSTLLKLILNILTPLKGTIKINSNRIGYVPQGTENFNFAFPITIYEMLMCHAKSLKLKNPDSLIDKSLKNIGMENYKNSLLGSLSGGQKQKIFLARSLIGNPELLILDEPSTGVDVKSQKEIYSFLKELNSKNGMTIVCVEHNLNAAYKNSTHIFKLNKNNGTLFNIKDFLKINKEVLNND
ncbi:MULTISPECIES: metal ABC transporter ATP-binding protein [Clostridium]|uniref:metal ABC transporter ATP-binding protein n=1 Tax=Clostridium TaxID=1485 RepID=UPI000826CE28|nr:MULTISPECIES: metal ABC transporter ATP-binding protein [Clostridium]PJI09146.1 metal ABC transporter ATP-binding protein [Clostridium sp. CT7]